ncbi:uncharacterized protein LOC135500616 isoform X2 [Lineus longissimus]|uniref:uncharacterized protein LOC135500616 isoform X2 n=1 Tax=Lineus longissimus TaxID=88925 RepID=UPI00315D3450
MYKKVSITDVVFLVVNGQGKTVSDNETLGRDGRRVYSQTRVCPKGYISFGDFTGLCCYLISYSRKVEWRYAQKQCLSAGAKLAELETANEFDMLRMYMKRFLSNMKFVPERNLGFSLGALNTLDRPYEYRWVTSHVKLNYNRWAPLQPDLERGRRVEQQLSMWSTKNYCLDDAATNKAYGYICEYSGESVFVGL